MIPTWNPTGGLGPVPTLMSLYCKPDSVVTMLTFGKKYKMIYHSQDIISTNNHYRLKFKTLCFPVYLLVYIFYIEQDPVISFTKLLELFLNHYISKSQTAY